MSSVIELLRSWSWPRVIALMVISIAVAGCSAETSRFNESPFAAKASNDYTASVPSQTASVGHVEQSQLPPPPPGAGRPAPAASGVSGNGQGMASYGPAAGPDTTGSVQGTPGATRPAAGSAVRPPSGPAASAGAGIHVVARGDTLSKISRRYKKPVADIAKANNIETHATLKVGDRLIIPGLRPSNARLENATKPAKAKSASDAVKTDAGPPQTASMVTPAAEAPAPPAKPATEASPLFRWPVKGRVIAGFGPKTNGQQNDGINLAVPEGTAVKAAEDGVVAYAGNELKGYGNLVLVRHSNGYVTAYAHAKELTVKRGDQVKRGQIIAKSGQTGNVDAPQLHFEIRKGPSPIDPVPLLSGG